MFHIATHFSPQPLELASFTASLPQFPQFPQCPPQCPPQCRFPGPPRRPAARSPRRRSRRSRSRSPRSRRSRRRGSCSRCCGCTGRWAGFGGVWGSLVEFGGFGVEFLIESAPFARIMASQVSLLKGACKMPQPGIGVEVTQGCSAQNRRPSLRIE